MMNQNNEEINVKMECEDEDGEGIVAAVNRQLFFFSDINPTTTGNFLMSLEELDCEEGPIIIKICSMGGWVEGGLAMYDAIRSTQNEVITIGCGAVYSSAVLPFMAGSKRLMNPSARIFLHDIHLETPGGMTLDSAKSVIAETDKLFDLYCRIVSERSGIAVAEIAKFCKKETYLDAPDCLTNKLCDHILAMKDLPKAK